MKKAPALRPAMLASGVFAGIHTQDWAYARTDSDGKSFGDELTRIGWRGEEAVGARKMHAFFELHIEQGPILEAEGVDIGVVTHGQGLSWTQVTITGKDAHTGSTPMPMRKNAGLGMARVLNLVDEIALSHAPDAVGAAGHIDVFPNSRNVIPGQVVFTIDFRSPDLAVIEDMETRLKTGAQKICGDMGLEVTHLKRLVGLIRWPLTRAVSALCAMPQSAWAIATGISFRVPGMMPAGSIKWPQPR